MGFEYIQNIQSVDVVEAELHRIGYYRVMQQILHTQQIIDTMMQQCILSGATYL